MLDSDKKMVVMHLVEKVFLPDIMVILNRFVGDLKNQIIYKHEFKKEIGFDITLPTIPLDFRQAQIHLADSIAIALKDRTEKPQ